MRHAEQSAPKIHENFVSHRHSFHHCPHQHSWEANLRGHIVPPLQQRHPPGHQEVRAAPQTRGQARPHTSCSTRLVLVHETCPVATHSRKNVVVPDDLSQNRQTAPITFCSFIASSTDPLTHSFTSSSANILLDRYRRCIKVSKHMATYLCAPCLPFALLFTCVFKLQHTRPPPHTRQHSPQICDFGLSKLFDAYSVSPAMVHCERCHLAASNEH